MSDQEICEKLRKWIPFAAPGLDTLLEIAAQRLESLQRERKEHHDWTPCAEVMPEDSPDFQSMSRYECTILIPDGTREVFTLQRTGNGKWLYETGKGLDTVHGDQVVAWRKMSYPYNHDRKEDAE